MNPLTFEYKISLGEYHAAVYFALVTRYRTQMRIFIVVAAVALLCFVGGFLGLMPVIAFPSYIFLGYLIWLAYLLARTEHGVLRITKSPENPLRHDIRLEFTRDTLKVETPHNKSKAVHQLTGLFLAFELSNLFLLYLDGANTIILPTRLMSAEQRTALRERLADSLHERFQTRFGIIKAPKIQPLTKRRRFF